VKRVCGNCRAFQRVDFHVSCMLGHPIQAVTMRTKFGPLIRGKPTEECEKPTTNDELVKLLGTRT